MSKPGGFLGRDGDAWVMAWMTATAACGSRSGLDGYTSDRVTEDGAGGVRAAAGRAGSAGVSEDARAIAVDSGFSSNSCALLSDGSLRCWGRGSLGQVGDGDTQDRLIPTPVSGVDSAVAIAVGGYHSCTALESGDVQCWGDGSEGVLGGVAFSSVPLTLSGTSPSAFVDSGAYHACALTRNARVQCWGANSRGELGTGVPGGESRTPVFVKGVRGAIAVATGLQHSCALLENGTVSCWGDGVGGPLGNGSTDSGIHGPVEVSNLSDAVAVSAGNSISCAVSRDGRVRCWGDAHLGNGTFGGSPTPVLVSEISDAIAVSCGVFHSCALLRTGIAKCWGANDLGELGDGTRINRSAPVTVVGLSDIVALSAGNEHTCAVSRTGAVWCWGWNYSGALGDGTESNRLTPVRVVGL